jgi:hypothetical protein
MPDTGDSCVRRTPVCVQEADQRRRDCSDYEDQGYDNCTRREDRGHSECDTWQIFVWVSKWVCVAWTWVSKVVCVAWTWIVETVCLAWTTLVYVVCRVVEFTVTALTAALSAFTGTSRIEESTLGRPVGGNRRNWTDSRSPAAPLDYNRLEQRLAFRDGGRYFRFRLTPAGAVEFNDSFPGNTFRDFAPVGAVFNSPPNPDGRALSVSYDRSRLGRWLVGDEVPRFDMLAASSDRVFAKELGLDNFFLALPTEVYLHRTAAGERAVLPQSFFKLDPELGEPTENVDDLLLHLNVSPDDERHLATERFPLFRSLFRLLESPLENIEVLRNAMQSMVVQAHPFVWVRLDTRPGRGGEGVPIDFPSYVHATYRKDGLFGTVKRETQHSIRFDLVLDLGVGLSHLHEQYEPIYGGEIDILDVPSSIPGVSNEDLYRFANGPIQDVGGWVDGTSIYYLLVGLPSVDSANKSVLDAELGPTDETDVRNRYFRDRFAVLWVDEQLYFTGRWRALSPRDSKFGVGQPASAVVAAHDNPFHFRETRFKDPFREGRIRSFSRMAVARQVIVVNGLDKPDDSPGRHRLYSIHFSWPTMDRTWRVRDLPPGAAVQLVAHDAAHDTVTRILAEATTATVLPQTIHLREDMTLHLCGTRIIDRKVVPGRWVQKYLPADNNEVPAASVVQSGNDAERSVAYGHPWQFYSEAAFLRMHQRFSHFGVYEAVESRCQFYHLDILEPRPPRSIEATTWVDAGGAAKIQRLELNYAKLASVIDAAMLAVPAALLVSIALGLVTRSPVIALLMLVVLLAAEAGLAFAYAVERKSFPSLYENVLRFRIRFTAIGPLLFYADKREDKNISFDKLPVSILLASEDGTDAKLQVVVRRHVRSRRSIATRGILSPPEIASANIVAELDSTGNVTRVRVTCVSARALSDVQALDFGDLQSEAAFDKWFALNVDQVRIGIPESSTGDNVLFSAPRDGVIARDAGTNRFSFEWTPQPTDPHFAELAFLLSENGQVLRGTSLWFIGISGLANIPGHAVFETRSPPAP